jgi:Mrp family chromosome partitioning ATPase
MATETARETAVPPETEGNETVIEQVTDRVDGGNGTQRPGLDEEVRDYHLEVLHHVRCAGEGPSGPLRALGITSCYTGEGVSTVAAQLALTAALDCDGRVLLVDCNLPGPSVHRRFGLGPCPGLAECLRQGALLPQAVRPSGVPRLSVMTAGQLHGSAARAYDSPAFPSLLKEWVGDFDTVICDMPAAARASSTARLARLLDGVLLVVEAERVRSDVACRVKELLLAADARLLGVVLNKRRGAAPDWLYRNW